MLRFFWCASKVRRVNFGKDQPTSRHIHSFERFVGVRAQRSRSSSIEYAQSQKKNRQRLPWTAEATATATTPFYRLPRARIKFDRQRGIPRLDPTPTRCHMYLPLSDKVGFALEDTEALKSIGGGTLTSAWA